MALENHSYSMESPQPPCSRCPSSHRIIPVSSSAFSSVVGQNHRSTESLKMGNTSKVIQGFQKAEGSFL